MTDDPVDLGTVFVDTDFRIDVVVDGTDEEDGSVSDYTFSYRVWDPDGAEIDSGLSVAVADAAARTVTAACVGLTLSPGRHTWEVRRTDSGYRTLVAHGRFTVKENRR